MATEPTRTVDAAAFWLLLGGAITTAGVWMLHGPGWALVCLGTTCAQLGVFKWLDRRRGTK